MKKKRSFLLPLLMAIVMMAMSPTRVWADNVTLDKDKLNQALKSVNNACSENGTFTLTFANSYSGSATGTEVGTGINFYNNGDGTCVVAPATAGNVIMAPADMYGAFIYCSKLKNIVFGNNLNTSNVTSMNYMFYGCSSLTSLDLRGFNTSNAMYMNSMFMYCSKLNSIVFGNNFNTSRVEDMSNMFSCCSNLTTIFVGDEWSTLALTSSQNMFLYCDNLKGQEGTTYSNDHIDANYARVDGGNSNPGYFSDGVTLDKDKLNQALKSVNNACSENGTFTLTFADSYSGSATGTEVGAGINLYNDGNNNYVVAPAIAGATIKAPSDMSGMFMYCSKLSSITFGNINTSKVTTMSNMFLGCSSLTELDLSGFNTTNVTDMSGMYMYCSKLSSLTFGNNYITSNVKDMSNMFSCCSILTSLNLSDFKTSNVTNLSGMFYSCSNLTGLDLSGFNTSNVTDMSGMFMYCTGLESITLGNNFDTSNVTNMMGMFAECTKLPSLDVSKFNTSKVTNMKAMFFCCIALPSITFGENFNTSNVTDMRAMFCYCQQLTSLDLSKFNTSKVTDMGFMFDNCIKIQSINIGYFDMSRVECSDSIFYACEKVESITLPNSMKSIAVGAFDGCTSLTSITLPSSVESIANGAFEGCTSLSSVTFNSIPLVASNVFNTCTSLNTKPLALSDDSYVYTGSENNNFPSLTTAPTYSRTMANEWGTLVLPFAVSAAPEGFEFYGVSGLIDGGTLCLEKITDAIAAGTPVFVRRTGEGTSLELTASSTTVTTAIATASGVALQGTYSSVNLTKTANPNDYFIYNNLLSSTSKLGDENYATVLPFHAYLCTPAASGAKLMIVVDGETTNIGQMENGEWRMENEAGAVFNLNGQKLSAPQKGINIINGRKVMVR